MRPRENSHRRYGRLLAAVFVTVTVIAAAAWWSSHQAKRARFRASAEALLDRTRRVVNGAGPDYQQSALSQLSENSYSGPVIRLDDLREAMWPAASTLPAGEPEYLLSLEFDDHGRPGVISALGGTRIQVAEGTARIVADSSDALVVTEDVELPREEIGDVIIRARAREGALFRIGWRAQPRNELDWENSHDFFLLADGKYHDYVIDARNTFRWGVPLGGSVRQLFFSPSHVDGNHVEIDFIRVVSKSSRYGQHGVDVEMLDGVTRRVLYMRTPGTLELELTVPSETPTFEAGLGLLYGDRPVRFRATVLNGDHGTVLLDERIADGDRWQDRRIDLGEWAGRPVRLELRVDTVEGDDLQNVAFWSNPVVYGTPLERLNVILILEDTLRADHLSCYGYDLPTSPTHDRLAADGILFRNAISQATKTRPSVPSMMTSLYPSATGVWNFSDTLAPTYLTLAEILRAQGFATAAFVQNSNAGRATGNHQGFGEFHDQDIVGSSSPEQAIGTRLFAWLERNRDRNVFSYVHVLSPHGPYDPPPPHDQWFRQQEPRGTPAAVQSDLDPEWVTAPTVEGRRLRYDGMIRHNDAVLSELDDRLKRAGIRDHTLLVIVSDHGEYLGEYGHWEHHPPGLLPVIHVPFIMTLPNRFAGGREILQRVQLLDLMPTILEVAGIDPGQFLLQGDSLVRLVDEPEAGYWENRLTVSEEPVSMTKAKTEIVGSVFYRDSQYVRSRFLGQAGGDEIHALVYDTSGDLDAPELAATTPAWTSSSGYAQLLREHLELNWAAWRKWTGGESGRISIDPAAIEQLRSLGYIE